MQAARRTNALGYEHLGRRVLPRAGLREARFPVGGHRPVHRNAAWSCALTALRVLPPGGVDLETGRDVFLADDILQSLRLYRQDR